MPTKKSPSLQQALAQVEPLLRKMNDNLSPRPKASRKSLQGLLKKAKEPKTKEPAKPTGTPLSSRIEDFSEDRIKKLAALREQALACTRCPNLVASRTQVVFGVGNPFAELMFVGEAPGEKEDLLGEPFVGRAGQMLTKIINAMEYQREDIFIGNVLKCRPNMPPNTPGNRKPKLEEMTTCLPWLQQQIDLIKPRVLVALGATALEGLLGKAIPMRDARGNWFDFQGIPTMVTYHPAYLLYSPSLTEKRKVWEDMLLVMEKLGRPISKKQRGYFLTK
ncbi:MAG: uracil-DNA glycosylase [Chthoniobacterales bacterium]|nr:uracil-DNA glycosylase [Chthoniobacterales bacterium]